MCCKGRKVEVLAILQVVGRATKGNRPTPLLGGKDQVLLSLLDF